MNVVTFNHFLTIGKVFLLTAIVGICISVSQSSLIDRAPVPTAVLFDLTLTLPFAYLIFIRKTSISKWTTIGVLLIGFILAINILPRTNTLEIAKLIVFPMFELTALGAAAFFIYRARKSFRALETENFDLMEKLRQTLTKDFPVPQAGKFIAFELSVFYYALVKWRATRRENSFTSYGEGVFALLGVVIFIVTTETLVVHMLVAKWNLTAAWILTALGAYFIFQLVTHAKAIYLRSHEIREDSIFLRNGIFGDARIGIENIAAIEPAEQSERQQDAVYLTPLGKFSAPNVKICLHEPETFYGFYNIEKSGKTVFIKIDDAPRFIADLKSKITKTGEING